MDWNHQAQSFSTIDGLSSDTLFVGVDCPQPELWPIARNPYLAEGPPSNCKKFTLRRWRRRGGLPMRQAPLTSPTPPKEPRRRPKTSRMPSCWWVFSRRLSVDFLIYFGLMAELRKSNSTSLLFFQVSESGLKPNQAIALLAVEGVTVRSDELSRALTPLVLEFVKKWGQAEEERAARESSADPEYIDKVIEVKPESLAEIYGIQVGKWWNHLSLLSAPAADSHNCFKDDIILGDSLQPTTDMKWLKYRVSIRPATFSVTRKHLNFRDNPIYKISPNGQKAILRMNSSYSIHRFVFNPEKVQTTVSNLGFNVFRLELYTK